MRTAPASRLILRLLPVLWVAALWLPIVQMVFHPFTLRSSLAENRTKEPPLLLRDGRLGSITAFAAAFDQYFRDNFGFRDELISTHHRLLYDVLRTSTNDKVALGEDGWLYFDTPSDGDCIKDYCGLKPFEEHQLDIIETNLSSLSAYLRERQILFAILLAPDKNTIYPEHLPAKIRGLAGESRLEQFTRMLARNPDILFVDPRRALLEGKSRSPVYFRADSHWNGFGAFLAFRELMNGLANAGANVAVPSEEEFRLERLPPAVRDLGVMMGVPEFAAEEDVTFQRISAPPPREHPAAGNSRKRAVTCETDAPQRPRMVMLRDSFSTPLQPLLCREFSHSTYIWQYNLGSKTLELEKPSIVVLEITERHLDHLDGRKMLQDLGIDARTIRRRS